MNIKLETKFFWILIAGVAFFFGLLTYLIIDRESRLVMEFYAENSSRLADTVAAQLRTAMIEKDQSMVKKHLNAFNASSDINVGVFGPGGSPAFGTETVMPREAMGVLEDKTIVNAKALIIIKPLNNSAECHACHKPDEPLRGTVLIRTSLQRAHAEVNSTKKRLILFGIVLGLLGEVFLITVLRKLVIKPIEALHNGAEKIRKGHTGHRVSIKSNDEMGRLGDVFNQMAEEIETSRFNLESTVKQKTSELRAIAELSADVFRGGRAMDELIEIYLVTLTQAMGYSSAAVCFLDKDTGALIREYVKGTSGAHCTSNIPLSSQHRIAECMRDLTPAVMTAAEAGISVSAGQVAVVPIISPYRKRCREILQCTHTDCPAYSSSDDRCWLIMDTLCRSPLAVAGHEKIYGCAHCSVFPVQGVILAAKGGDISPSSLNSIEILAATLSSAIDNLRLIEGSRDEITSLLRLHDIYVEKIRHLNLDSLIKSIATYATAFADTDSAVLWRTGYDGRFHLAEASNIEKRCLPASIPDDSPCVGEAVRESRLVETVALKDIPWANEAAKDNALLYMAAVPLNFEGRSYGCLTLFRKKDVFMSDSEKAIVSLFANQSAAAINAATVYGKLHDQKEFSDSVFNNMTTGIMVIDKDGSIIRVNRAANGTLGLTDDDLIGNPLNEVLPEATGFLNPTGDHSNEIEVTIGDRTIPLGYNTSTFRDQSREIAGTIVVFRDITDIIKLRHEKKKQHHLEAMGKVIAGVAHEVRNPLFAISSIAQILERESVSQKHKPLIKALLKETARMKHLIDEFVLYSRPSKLHLSAVDLGAFLKTIKDYSLSINEHLSVTVKLPSALSVKADMGKLDIAFRNLVDNSLKAGANTIAIIVSESGGIVSIDLRDDGSGIKDRYIEQVFEPFFTTIKEGNGLGLSICRKIIEEHGGTIGIVSGDGKGTTVSVSLTAYGKARS